jgi:broad-specificity NMP kinase
VRENLESEAIDVCGQEAAGAHRRVLEFDGTGTEPERVAAAVLRAALGEEGTEGPGPREPGEIDFTESIMDMY